MDVKPDTAQDRGHEPGVDPPIRPGEVEQWRAWAKTLTAIQLRQHYRRYWEMGERLVGICSVIMDEGARRYEAGEMDWQGNEIRPQSQKGRRRVSATKDQPRCVHHLRKAQG